MTLKLIAQSTLQGFAKEKKRPSDVVKRDALNLQEDYWHMDGRPARSEPEPSLRVSCQLAGGGDNRRGQLAQIRARAIERR